MLDTLFLHAELIGKMLGVSSTTAYELLHQKDFPSIRVGSRLVVPKEKFMEWVNRRTSERVFLPTAIGMCRAAPYPRKDGLIHRVDL